MFDKRKRSQNFSVEEKDKLLKLLLEHKETILNKKTDGTSNNAKASAWIEITTSFNESGSLYRSKESLIKVWEKMKSESKLYYTKTRRHLAQTGVVLTAIKIDPILERVCEILARGTEIENDTDSDSIVQEPNFAKVVCVDTANCETDTTQLHDIEDDTMDRPLVEPEILISTPELLSRRRSESFSNNNERSQATDSLCPTMKSINKKRKDVENLKYILLKEELESKRKLYKLQIQAATKDLLIKDLDIEIKQAILKKFNNGSISQDAINLP